MVRFANAYAFDTPAGPKTLFDLFEGREQLVVYQFMDNGPDDYCPGCTWLTNNIPQAAPAALAEGGVTAAPHLRIGRKRRPDPAVSAAGQRRFSPVAHPAMDG